MLVLFEAAGMSGEYATYLIRTLLSEGVSGTAPSSPSLTGCTPASVVREGPAGLITTTTQVSLHPENETRLLSIPVDDSASRPRRDARDRRRGRPRSRPTSASGTRSSTGSRTAPRRRGAVRDAARELDPADRGPSAARRRHAAGARARARATAPRHPRDVADTGSSRPWTTMTLSASSSRASSATKSTPRCRRRRGRRSMR